MDIRMGQLRDLAAGRALSARVPVAAVGAVQVLGIGDRQRQCPDAFAANEELGMADSSARYALNQFGGGFLLSCDLFKLHGFVV